MDQVTHSATTPQHDPVVKESVQTKASQPTEYEKSLQIVLGTVFGVFGVLGILIIGTLVYRFCKNRNRPSISGSSDRNPSLHRSVSIDLEQKQVPSVLLLYSNDCSAHEKVVESLAGFLIETCNCNVHLDIFEEQIIHERGLDEWLVDKLQEVEFIIVLSSVGARLRCCKKKVRFKIDPNHTLPDYFAVAVDYVAEKMRVERSKGMPLTTFCVVYMDYSSENDIPPQLEMGFKFCLMKDMQSLFCHLHGINGEPTKDGVPIAGLSEDSYYVSEMGQELRVAMESAKEYFRSNPGWVEDRMEPLPNPGKSKSRHVRNSSLEPLLGGPILKDNSLAPPPENGFISKQNEIMNQNMPKIPLNSYIMPLVPLQNRQNSFPSSLSSHQTSTPPLQLNSKSCDNLPPDLANRCSMCGQEGHLVACPNCSKGEQLLSTQEVNENEESVKSKSKSMPTVYRNSLYSSQTIFQAEVHRNWDDHDPEGRLSPTDSQDTVSNHDSIVDDLERDLDSIMNPGHRGQVRPISYSHTSYDNVMGVYTNPLPTTAKMTKITEIVNQKNLMPTNYNMSLKETVITNLQTTNDTEKEIDYSHRDAEIDQNHRDALKLMSHDLKYVSVDPDQIQLNDIKF